MNENCTNDANNSIATCPADDGQTNFSLEFVSFRSLYPLKSVPDSDRLSLNFFQLVKAQKLALI